MKIALVTPDVHRHAGVPNYVASLAMALAVEHEVSILSANADELGDASINLHKVWSIGGSGFIRSFTFSLASTLLLFLSRFREWGRYDIIHTHGDYTGLESIMTSHYCQATENERLRQDPDKVTFGQRLQLFGMYLLEKRMVRQSQEKPIIVPSERMKQDFMKHHGADANNTIVIHSGVDSEKYSPRDVSSHRFDVRERHSIGDDASIILFVGGDWDRKGLATTIKAFSLLNYPEAVLLVVGPGCVDTYQQIARDHGVEDRVIFAGSNKEVWKYYAASDALVLPTYNEAFGLVILEAMSSALPVLVSGLAGASELVKDGVNGLIIDPSDPSDIAAKLDAILLHENLRVSLGKEARKTALKYNWDLVAQRHIEMYKAILSHNSIELSQSGALDT